MLLVIGYWVARNEIIDSKAVRDKVCSEIKETAGAEIDFKHLVLDFFPHPHLIFDQVTLAVPPGVRGKAASIRIRPKDLVADLFPDAPIRIADAPANLTIDFKMNEPWQLQAELNGSSPHLKFRTAKDQQLNPAKTCLVGKTFKADETYNVKGTLDNIHIYSPAPSAVAYELAEMMKKTVERPINLIHGGKAPEKNSKEGE